MCQTIVTRFFLKQNENKRDNDQYLQIVFSSYICSCGISIETLKSTSTERHYKAVYNTWIDAFMTCVSRSTMQH